MIASPKERFESASLHGLLVEALEAILDATDQHPAARVRLIDWLARRFGEVGAIHGSALEGRIRMLHVEASEPPKRHIEELWASRTDLPGVARFPVALRGDRRPAAGTILRIEVGPEFVPSNAVDPSARDAVERARKAASDRFRGNQLDRVGWRILPTLAERCCEGSSVGLAAYVAFASFVLGRRLPADHAFTGVQDEIVGERWRCPDARELPAKIDAVDRHGLRLLHCPSFPRDLGTGRVDVENEPGGRAIELALGLRPGSGADFVGDEEVTLRLAAVLVAAASPIDERTVHEALLEPVWGKELSLGIVETRLRGLVARGWAVEGTDGFEPRAVPALGVRLVRAHLALRGVMVRRPALDPHGTRQLHHLFHAEDDEAVMRALPGLVEAAPREALLQALRAMRETSRRGVEPFDRIVRTLARIDRLDAVFLAVALRCDASISHVRRLADRLGSSSRGVLDDLLWLQAVTEAGLHFVAAFTIAGGFAPADGRLTGCLARPSVGALVDVITGMAPDAPPSLQAIAAELRKAPMNLAQAWNALLHYTGAWNDRAGAHPPVDAMLVAARFAVALLEELRGERFPIERGTVLTTAGQAIDAGGLLVATDPGDDTLTAFFRGVYAGEARWFHLVDGGVLYARYDGTAEDLAATRGAALRGLHPAAKPPREATGLEKADVAALPTPVARAIARITHRDLLRRLAATDVAFSTLLRIVAFAVMVDAPDAEDGRRRGRPLKRALLERIAGAVDTEIVQALAGWLVRPERLTVARELVLALEWLEHCGGPLDKHASTIEAAARMCSELVTEWSLTGVELVASSRVEEWRFTGFRGPRPAARTVAGEPDVVVRGGGRDWSLGPFAELDGEKLWLLRDGRHWYAVGIGSDNEIVVENRRR